ncbi:hypothetical protein ACFWIB_41360 [Streptomyces sp. NPDC127051]|uniref:hypothetical protein n=1 Tax=Streptomyces sp. NPDC127051 TaxID=3347119 RepID=UPI00364A48EE
MKRAEACRLTRRLANEMQTKHRIYHTGFKGAKILVTGCKVAGEEILRAVAAILNEYNGSVYTGADMGVSALDMEVLAGMTPYVLSAVGSNSDPNAATAFGVVGAMEAWFDRRIRGQRVLVHGVGKVGRAAAIILAESGADVFTYDVDISVADVPGCQTVSDWLGCEVDVLVPCSRSELIDARIAEQLRCQAVIGSANAVLADECRTIDVLERRGITFIPGPVVNAGAVILDSIEHYAPAVFEGAQPQQVYEFIKNTIRSTASEFLMMRKVTGDSPMKTLTQLQHPSKICGMTFR